jgi:hypothetical protein
MTIITSECHHVSNGYRRGLRLRKRLKIAIIRSWRFLTLVVVGGPARGPFALVLKIAPWILPWIGFGLMMYSTDEKGRIPDELLIRR